jgi:hypothetical protein
MPPFRAGQRIGERDRPASAWWRWSRDLELGRQESSWWLGSDSIAMALFCAGKVTYVTSTCTILPATRQSFARLPSLSYFDA